MLRTLLASLPLSIGLAFAGTPLTEDEVDRFIGVAEVIHDADEEHDGLDFDVDVDEGNLMEALDLFVDKDGDIVLFTLIADQMLDHPEAGDDFRTALRENRFRDEDAFADVGNRLLTAMIRANMEDDDLMELRDMAAHAESVPAFVRPLLDRLGKLTDNLAEVSEADMELAREAEERLDALD